MRRLSKENINKIHALLLSTDKSIDVIAKIFGVSRHVVYQMNDGRIHKAESVEYPIRQLNRRRSRISGRQVEQVKGMLADGLSFLDIVERTSIAKDTIAKIKDGDLTA